MKSRDKEYQNIHAWLRYNYEKPKNCQNKNCSGEGKRIEWALKNNYKHEKNINNYVALCSKCHRIKDLGNIPKSEATKIKISNSKKGVPVGVGKVLSVEHKEAIRKGMKKHFLNKK